jgi:hypothetical protein
VIKSKKSKSTVKSSNAKTKDTTPLTKVVASASNQSAGGADGDSSTAKPGPSKPYKLSKPPGLNNKQKAALAHHVMVRVGDLMAMDDTQLANEDLVGIDRVLMGQQLAAWVS